MMPNQKKPVKNVATYLQLPLDVHEALRREQGRLLYERGERVTLKNLIIERLRKYEKEIS